MGDGTMRDGGHWAHPECYYRQRVRELEHVLISLLVDCTCTFNDCEIHHTARELVGLSHDPDEAKLQARRRNYV